MKSQEGSLSYWRVTLVADVRVIGFSKIDDLGDESALDHDVDGLEVKVQDIAAVEVTQSMHHIQQEVQSGEKRH